MSRADLDAQRALQKLCDQLDGMKRRMFHTPGTGQNHSYLIHEDVSAYVEQARKTLVAPVHQDDLAVDRFALAMKAKLAASRDKGRSGWDDEAQCSMASLAAMLVSHVAKGDPVDVANFAMMLHQREAAAMEHHPCYGGDARRYLALATQAPVQDRQVVFPEISNVDEVIRFSDQSVRIRFQSARSASEFERWARVAIDAARKAVP